MNNFFDFKRFTKLLKMELMERINFILKFAAVLCLIIVVFWLLNKLIGNVSINMANRISFFTLCYVVTLFCAPFVLYKNHNHPKKGVGYASLPASGNEKFASMLLNSVILMPVIVFTLLFCTDSLMVLIDTSSLKESLILSEYFFNKSNIKDALLLLSVQPLFIFGNTYFIKNKGIKTVLSVVFIYVISLVAYLLVLKHLERNAHEWVLNNRIIIDAVVSKGFVVFNICFLVLSYFRVKTQQYK